jgi:hypothetical protein
MTQVSKHSSSVTISINKTYAGKSRIRQKRSLPRLYGRRMYVAIQLCISHHNHRNRNRDLYNVIADSQRFCHNSCDIPDRGWRDPERDEQTAN